jgi:hypothetical protein
LCQSIRAPKLVCSSETVAEEERMEYNSSSRTTKAALRQINYGLRMYDMSCASSIYMEILRNMKANEK